MKFDFNQQCPVWINNGPWYNTKFCSHLRSSYFDDFCTTEQHGRYDLMCYVNYHDKMHVTCYYYVGSEGGRPLPYGSKISSIKYLCNNLNFIDI